MKIIVILFTVLAYCFFFQIYPNYVNANESSRFLLTAAIVEDHSFQIDRAMGRYGDTQDKSIYKGHYYATKAIGYSLVAVPFFAFLRSLGTTSDAAIYIWQLRFFLNLLPLSLFVIFLFRFFATRLELSNRAYLLIISLLFGSLFYTYGQLFMSHMLSGILWFLGFYLVTEHDDPRGSLAAGAVLGFAFLVELLSYIPMVACGIYLLLRKRSGVIPFALGAFLFSLPAFLYNWHVFDGPLNWAYQHTWYPEFQTNTARGFMGFLWPSPVAFWKLAFGSSRGIFFYMPHLLFGVAGLLTEKERKAEAVLALSIIFGTFLFVSGDITWEGGWCFGARYLVPVIPLLIYGAALWLRRVDVGVSKTIYLYLILLAGTIPNILFGTVTWPFTPRVLSNPIFWENITLFWRGFFGINLGRLFDFRDRTIEIVAIALILAPAILLAFRARLTTIQALVFSGFLTLLFPLSFFVGKQAERRASANHCISIARAGYFQANYLKARVFLKYASQREPDDIARWDIRKLSDLIREQGE